MWRQLPEGSHTRGDLYRLVEMLQAIAAEQPEKLVVCHALLAKLEVVVANASVYGLAA